MKKPKLTTLLALTSLVLTTLPVLGTAVYFLLLLFNQHAYGALDIRLSEVGIDRSQLIDQTLVGAGSLVILLPVTFGVVVLITAAIVAVSLRLGATKLWARVPLATHSKLARRRRARSTAIDWRSVFLAAGAVSLFLSAAFMYLLWTEGPRVARSVRSGRSYSGRIAPGIYALDIDALPFRFTKLPAQHDFDRACVLYLGRADGELVLYDTQHDRALHLKEAEYAGQPRWNDSGPPQRCEAVAPSWRPLLTTRDEIDDVDAGAGVMVWSQKTGGSRPWSLLARAHGRTILIASSDASTAPDLGRDRAGTVVLTYRECVGRRCATRLYSMRTHHTMTLHTPHVDGCAAMRAASHVEVQAFLLRGRRCPARGRGVWTKATGRLWRHVAGTAQASGDLDAFDDSVAWVERRGPLVAVRTMTVGNAPRTIFEDATGLSDAPSRVTAVRLVRGGVYWAATASDHHGAWIVSRPLPHGAYRVHGTIWTSPTATGPFVPLAKTALAVGVNGLGEMESRFGVDRGIRLSPAGATDLGGRRCAA